MKFSSVLIVTYGRTGSTLLMGILNSIPGILIRGENMNLCAGLHSAHQSLNTAKNDHGKTVQDTTKPFYGAECLDSESFLKDARSLIKRQLVPDDRTDVQCWGFKEIRYTPTIMRHGGKYGLANYLSFLSQLMPNPAFIFLTRQHEKVADSAFWRNRETNEAIDGMRQFENHAQKWSNGRHDCFWLTYEEMVNTPERLSRLYEFLGAKFDINVVRTVMSREHSYAGKADNLGQYVKPRISQPANAVEPPRQPPRIGFKKSNADLVKHATVEVLTTGSGGSIKHHISGVVVLKKKNKSVTNAQLALSTKQGEQILQWGLPSPVMGKKYGSNAMNAQAARYRSEQFPSADMEDASLYLVEDEKTRHLLFTFSSKFQSRNKNNS